MFEYTIENIKEKLLSGIYEKAFNTLELYTPKVIWAILLILLWIIICLGIYKFIIYLFKKFKIIEIIDKLSLKMDDPIKWEDSEEEEENKKKKNIKIKKISDKVKIDEVTAKAISYYVFLVFFRYSIVIIWINEVEVFLAELLAYLPSLFIAVVIWFFWVRFSNFVYDIIYHTLNLTKQKTSKIIASWAKIIILFFTLMVVLSKVWIATEITNTILIWFVSMLALAWWLAFWLWGKDIAQEILESFRK